MSIDYEAIRQGLLDIPENVSHTAVKPPEPEEIYTPRLHESALDPDRQLVIGGRGAGKSFWAGAMADTKAQKRIIRAYPKIKLGQATVALGFTGEKRSVDNGIAPSPDIIGDQLRKGFEASHIWYAVIVRALRDWAGMSIPQRFGEIVQWVAEDTERLETVLENADGALSKNKKQCIIIFDALDRVAKTWPQIRLLTRELLRTALELRPYRAIRLKIFLRQDLADDQKIMDFVDASKLFAERVELSWRVEDLYGLLYFTLLKDDRYRKAFEAIVVGEGEYVQNSDAGPVLPNRLRSDRELQARIFAKIAGQYMGKDPRRGRTYQWLPNHLADGRGFVSPRSFLTLLRHAAQEASPSLRQVIDYRGINEGLLGASDLRLRQLRDEYHWIDLALKPLARLEVPNFDVAFVRRWSEEGTVNGIREEAQSRSEDYLIPIELEDATVNPEWKLLGAMSRIGVLELRSDDRLNMPDIFRIAADLVRRGGVPNRKKRKGA
jgi:hypothetical protein